MQTFNLSAQALGLKSNSGLVLDVHRWNSTFGMLNEALKYKVALTGYAIEQYVVLQPYGIFLVL
jgi:hypothetical protein